MHKKLKKNCILTFLSITLIVLPIHLFIYNGFRQLIINNENNLTEPKISAVYEDIVIDDLPSSPYNWNWAIAQPWCIQGTGTSEDPYIIEGHSFIFSSGSPESLIIRNSRKYFTIRNCTIKNSLSDWAGLLLMNVTNGLVNENFVYDNGWGIALVGTNDTIISDNFVYNSGFAHGISLDDNSHFNNVTGNKVFNNTIDGIYLEESVNNAIFGNDVYDNTENGIHLATYSDFNTLSGNLIYNNEDRGFLIETCDDNSLTGNVVRNNTLGGINIQGTIISSSINNNFTNNIIRDNGGYGVQFGRYTDNNLLWENFFLRNEKHAYDESILNKWNSTIIGNYWDNWTSPDDNPPYGIVDDPFIYILGAVGNNDYLPIAEDGAPTININSPDPDDILDITAPSFNVRIVDDYLDAMWYTMDGGLNNYTFTDNGTIDQTAWEAMPEGKLTLEFYASDIPGNIGTAEVIIDKDTQIPIITINSPTLDDLFGVNAPSFNVRITDDYLDTMWYTIDGGLNNFTFTDNGTIDPTAWEAMTDSTITLTFHANDTVGHFVSAEVNIDKDIQAPVILINTPTLSNLFGDNAPSFNVRITDDHLDTMWYSIDAGLHNYSFTVNGSIDQPAWNAISDGAIVLKFCANDTIGHSKSTEISIEKDTNAPIIVINSPIEDDEFDNEPPLFNITVTDVHLDSIWYSFDDGLTRHAITNNTEFNQTLWAELPEGNVTITFFAVDTLGNEASESVTVVKNIPAGAPYTGVIITVVVVSIVGGVAVVAVAFIFIKKRGMT